MTSRRFDAGRPMGDPQRDDTHQAQPRRRGRRWTRRRGSRPRDTGPGAGGEERPGGRDGRHMGARDRQDTLDDWAESDDDAVADGVDNAE